MSIQIPGYALFREISKSSRYRVFQGIRESDQKPILIKTLNSDHPSLEEIGSLKNEFELVRELSEDHLIKPLFIDKHLNRFFLVLEDKGLEPLSRLLKTKDFSIGDKLKISVKLANLLWTIQKRHIIHKDIQPNNIFIDPNTFEVQLTGFGIATKLARQRLIAINPALHVGEVAYISPEQTGRMNREVDYRTDFYSLGVVLYEIFCGKRPFESTDTIELIHAHLAQTPVEPYKINNNIPVTVSNLIMKLLSKGAYERYSSALSLMRDLERCLTEWTQNGSISPFNLGENDVSPTLHVSQKLYGREKEIEALTNLLENTPSSPPHMTLIGGFSGIGKSSLAFELQKPLIEKGGFFISGKFDQFKLNIPYSAFIQALQELVQQILTESDDRIDYWKFKIQKSLGKNAAVITDVIPEVKLIIGEPPKVPALDTEQTYNRFSLLFQQFITTFATPETPLVIFLDDLQWVDMASQKLIEILMMSHQTRGLLIVGAYRSNETDRFHPLKLLISHIAESNPTRITEMEVSPLSQADVSLLLSDTLHQSLANTEGLSKVIKEKTQGNPFFINQLLTYLADEKLLAFDTTKGQWSWDLEKVKNAKISENIVTLLISKLQKSTKETLEILKLAACTGHSFDVNILSHLSPYPAHLILKYLREALEDGFIVTDGHIAEFYWESTAELGETLSTQGKFETLKFSHDRVQQAVYSLISPDKRQAEHLKIGRILSKSIPGYETEEKIFDIVYQVNHAINLLEDPSERLLYAEYNLIAGKRAMKSVAHRTALDYLSIGYSLLPEDKWEQHYNLTYQLQMNLAECSFLTGEFEEAERLFNQTLKMARTDDEKIALYILKIKLMISTTKYNEAIENGRQALNLLGITLPKNISKLRLLKELAHVRFSLIGRDNHSIIHSPEITDVKKEKILFLLFILVAPAYLSAKEFYAYVTLLGVRYSLDWGQTPYTGYFFGGYGVIQNIIFRNMKALKRNGQLAMELCQRCVNQISVPATKFLVGTFVIPYYEHISESIKVQKSSFETGIVVGDSIYGVYSLAQMMANQFQSSLNLDELEKDILEYLEFVSKVKAHNRGYMFIGAEQAILALKGKTDAPWSLDNKNFSEKPFFKNLTDNNFLHSLYFIYVYKMQICFLFEKYDEAIEVGYAAEKINFSVRGHPINTDRDFYYALSVMQKNTPPKRNERKEIQKILKQLKIFADACPENFEFKYYLIMAEQARINGQKEEASEFYDKAVDSPKENDFIQFSAMANELFAKYWLSLNKNTLARQHLIEAHYGYYYWGASEKVKQLETKYPFILQNNFQSHVGATLGQNKDEKGGARTLDAASIVKSSAVITGQLDLEILMKDLLNILIENAGAERAMLVLDQDGKWMLKAEATKDLFKGTHDGLLDKTDLLSYSVIYYVIRTKESLVLDNAAEQGIFTTDPYIAQRGAKSIMALPLMHQGKVTGALWLENNLITNAFTNDRVEVLKLLSAQIANSIENARLYSRQAKLSQELQASNLQLEDYSQNLEKKVYLRTHELKEKNEQLQDTLAQIKQMQATMVQQEKLVSLGAITKSIATEVRNPLSYVFNFAKMAKELLQDLKGKIPQTESEGLIDQVVENLNKIDSHAEKADEIITRMVEESRTTDLVNEPTDLNKLIRDYADLVYYNYYKKDPLFVLSIETHWDQTLDKVSLTPQNIGKVIYGIIDNSCYSTDQKKKASEQGQGYTPSLSISTKKMEEFVEIKIRDNGTGIPKESLDKIFTSYTSTKPQNKGAGMGLAMSYDIIVKEHKGAISIQSEVGVYTEVTLHLPI